MTTGIDRRLALVLRYAGRPWVITAVVVAAWLVSGIYVVEKVEHGVLQVCGRVVAERVPPGLHYGPPWPIGRVHSVDTTSQHTMSVGFRMRDVVLDIPTPPEESRWLTGDTNIIEVRLVLQYRASDPVRYVLGSDDPDDLVRRAGEAVVTDLVGHVGVEVLTSARGALVSHSLVEIQRVLDEWSSGITITSVSFEGVDPPREVVDAFHDVQNAKADKARMREEAEAYANAIVPEARGEAAKQRAAAAAFRESRVAEADGWSRRFGELNPVYQTAPSATRNRLYLEAAEELLSRGDLLIVDPAGSNEQQNLVLIRSAPAD